MLTPRQHKALDSGHHLSVTANAGSGKTRVLVERYLGILLDRRAEVGEIVALTYTDKAAGELKRRIAEKASDAIPASLDPIVAHRLEEIREQLPGAFIGTIHSFCSRILREYPVEAGVDAAFGVIEGLDQHVMLNESMKEAFRAILKGGVGPREGFVEVVRRMGKGATIEAVRRLVEKREHLETLTGPGGIYELPDERILFTWRTEVEGRIADRLLNPGTAGDLERVVHAADGKGSKGVRDAHAGFLIAADRHARLRSGWDLLQILLKKDGGLYRSVATVAAESAVAREVARLGDLRDALTPLVPMLTDLHAEADHRTLLRMTRTLLDVVQHVNERYESRKADAGKLDFEDLQLRARALLRREPVRKQLAGRFKYIMVDEYQDTNQLQYDILRPLLSDLATGNLCIVGDPKQSIYGFRDADVGVFEKTRKDIVAAAGGGSDIVLGESFRPLRDLVAFVNLVFAPLMGPGGATDGGRGETYEVGYEPLVRARQNHARGHVELLLDDDDAEPDAATLEGDRIARRVLQCVSSGHPVFDAGERPHPVRYRDIAVLLRSRTHLPEIEGAFVRLGVPYVVTGGIGYFQTQDILDYFNYLQFLVNPSDDVALAGILRSPFFAVSDLELFEVAAQGRQGGLWDDLCARVDLAGRLKDAIAALREDRVVCLRMPVPEVLSHITRNRLYLPKILGTARGAQAVANLEKLQRMARSYDVQGFTTLHDFTRRLRRLIDEEEDEGQGNIETQRDAVQVMTVHDAKGLEFPVVILPFLHRKFRTDRSPFIHPALGVAFNFQRDDGAEVFPPLVSVLKEEACKRSVAEEKRVLYVACTRARDMLVLSGRHALRERELSWMGWLLKGMAWDAKESPDRLTFACMTRTLGQGDTEFLLSEEAHDLSVPVVRTSQLPAGGALASLGPRETVAPRITMTPLPAGGKGEIFSATRIRTYGECPALYYIKYILGLPGDAERSVGGESEETADTEYPAELRGRLFHAVMQRIDALEAEPFAIAAAARRYLLSEVSVEGDEADRLVHDITARVLSVLGSDLWRESGGATEIRTEFTISTVLDNDYLSGTIDRVYRDGLGGWHVLDYKTDRVDASNVLARAETYWPQLEFYALLVHRFFDAPEVGATLLFTSLVDTPFRRTFSANDLSYFEKEIRSTIANIKSGNFRPNQTPCPGCPMMPRGCQLLFR